MGKSYRVLDIGFTSGLGKCSVCMRSAFVAAVICWTIAGFVFFATTNMWFLSGAFALAAASILLVFAHVSAFALRMARATMPQIAGVKAGMDRRAFGKRLTRMFIFGTLVTIAPWSLAKAQGCNCYSDDNCSCSDPAFPQCVFNPGTSEAVCCGQNDRGCAGPTQTWCCPPGTDCSGQEGYCLRPPQ